MSIIFNGSKFSDDATALDIAVADLRKTLKRQEAEYLSTICNLSDDFDVSRKNEIISHVHSLKTRLTELGAAYTSFLDNEGNFVKDHVTGETVALSSVKFSDDGDDV